MWFISVLKRHICVSAFHNKLRVRYGTIWKYKHIHNLDEISFKLLYYHKTGHNTQQVKLHIFFTLKNVKLMFENCFAFFRLLCKAWSYLHPHIIHSDAYVLKWGLINFWNISHGHFRHWMNEWTHVDRRSKATCEVNLVTVAQVAVALPAAGTGAAEARGRLGDGGLGAQRRVLVLTADEFRLWWRTLPHLPQTCSRACRHGDAAAADADWNRCREKRRWAERKRRRLHWWNVWK